jgi:hypothetical protein
MNVYFRRLPPISSPILRGSPLHNRIFSNFTILTFKFVPQPPVTAAQAPPKHISICTYTAFVLTLNLRFEMKRKENK